TASARRGWTKFGGGAFTTSGYSVDFEKLVVWSTDDTLAIRLSQPLRADGGGFSMLLPTSYDYGTGSPNFDRARMSLMPKGREAVAEIGYAKPLSFGWAGFNLYARRQPGHNAAA